MATKTTTYVVLSGPELGDDWREIDRIEATGAGAAQRTAYARHSNGERMRVSVVPARSWMPAMIGTKSKPQLVIENIATTARTMASSEA